MALQAAILRIPIIKEWAGIRPPPPASLVLAAPTMLETLKAGMNKFKSFNEQRFEQIAANAVAKANKDMKKREEEARKAKQSQGAASKPGMTLSQRRGLKSKTR